MGLYSEGLTIRRIFASEMHGGGGGAYFFWAGGLIFGRTYYYFFLGGGGGRAYRNFTVCQLLRFLKITGGIYTCTFSIIFDFFAEYLLSLQLGKYSPILTKPKANNCYYYYYFFFLTEETALLRLLSYVMHSEQCSSYKMNVAFKS